MIPPRRKVFLEVINHEEYVQVEPKYGPDGKVAGGTPIEGTRTAFLHLLAPDGTVIRAEIPHGHLDRVLAMVFPDMLSPEEIASHTLPRHTQ